MVTVSFPDTNKQNFKEIRCRLIAKEVMTNENSPYIDSAKIVGAEHENGRQLADRDRLSNH